MFVDSQPYLASHYVLISNVLQSFVCTEHYIFLFAFYASLSTYRVIVLTNRLHKLSCDRRKSVRGRFPSGRYAC